MERGDIYLCPLDPTKGREQQGTRYVLLLSTREFNKFGTQIVAPITQGGAGPRDAGFAVSLIGAGTNAQGVVICNQLRAIDLKARQAKRVEKAPDFIVNEALGKVAAIFEG
jgi:mRNA-degrading endonuclease toxin of MazEF toxin-antitoxin module